MTFLSLAIGYLIGRIIVSFVLLPKYIAGDLVTAYAFLGKRFGSGVQSTASVTFLFTRLLADGLRLFATARIRSGPGSRWGSTCRTTSAAAP